nr:uncharacterized protein LOC111426967 [Onthophagus taurus]
MVNLASLIWGVSSFFAANLFTAFPIFIGKEPIPLWYPYNSSASPYFELSHIFQFLAQNSMWYNYNILDIFYITIVVITAGQFKILTWELENICFSSLLASGYDKQRILHFQETLANSNGITEHDKCLDIYQFMLTDEYVKQFRIKIIKVVNFHRDILDFCDKLENFLATSLLMMFLSILSHCVLILYGTSLSTSMIHRLQMAVYFFSAVVESFLVAYPSDFLFEQHSNWNNRENNA